MWKTLRHITRWEEKCTCSGISLVGCIPIFRHAKTCPLYEQGVMDWSKVISV